jgi:hypothetical protein
MGERNTARNHDGVSSDERKKFSDLGPIRVSEMADFHDELERTYDLGALNAEFSKGQTTAATVNVASRNR